MSAISQYVTITLLAVIIIEKMEHKVHWRLSSRLITNNLASEASWIWPFDTSLYCSLQFIFLQLYTIWSLHRCGYEAYKFLEFTPHVSASRYEHFWRNLHVELKSTNDGVQHSEPLGLRTLSIVQNFKYYKNTMFLELNLFPSSGEEFPVIGVFFWGTKHSRHRRKVPHNEMCSFVSYVFVFPYLSSSIFTESESELRLDLMFHTNCQQNNQLHACLWKNNSRRLIGRPYGNL
jgi:hypothetical protein